MINAYEDSIIKAIESWDLEKKIIRNPGYRKLPGEEGYDEMKAGGYKRHQKYVNPETGGHELSPRITNWMQGEGFRADASEPRDPNSGLMGAAKNIGSRAVEGAKSVGGRAVEGAKSVAGGVKDAVMGTEGTDAADADINRRFSKLTGGDPNADPEGVFQGTPGMASQAKTAVGNKFSDLQGAAGKARDWVKDQDIGGKASNAFSSLRGAAGAAKDWTKDKLQGAAQGYTDWANRTAPKIDAQIDRGIQGAADLMGRGRDAASALNQRYNTPENRTAAWEGAKNVASRVGGGMLDAAKFIGQGAQRAAGRMAYGAVDPATGQRTGRDASGFINPNDKLGTIGAGIKGAVTGQGAMNAIEARNQRMLSTNDLNMDRTAQTQLKQGIRSADAERRLAAMPSNVHEGMQEAWGGAPGTPPNAGAAGAAPAATPTPGDADGDGVPDVEETMTTATDGTTGEVTTTHERTVTPPAPATTPDASSGGDGMSSGGDGMSSGTPTPKAAPSQSNRIAENALASEQAGKLAEANQRAGKSWSEGGVGTGLASNLLTMGGAGLARLGANALTRHGGRRDAKAARTSLQGMTGTDPTFTTSFDSPLDDYWGLQKTMHNFRMRDRTEAFRYALQ